MSSPTATRRGATPCASSSSACTSTSSGRLPSRATVTMLPGTGSARRDRKIADGLRTSLQPLFGHREHADLVRRAEAVLDRADDAETAAGIAFEIEHRVDHVLEDARTGDQALLGDVADQEHRGAAFLRVAHQTRGGLAHLGCRPRRRFARLGLHGLDRIDDEHLGRGGRGGIEYRLDARFREQPQAGRREPEPPRAKRDLAHRFLARGIYDRALTRQCIGRLQQHG